MFFYFSFADQFEDDSVSGNVRRRTRTSFEGPANKISTNKSSTSQGYYFQEGDLVDNSQQRRLRSSSNNVTAT